MKKACKKHGKVFLALLMCMIMFFSAASAIDTGTCTADRHTGPFRDTPTGRVCTACGIRVSDGHTHSWGSWQIITAANCRTTGVRQHTCVSCGQTERETTSKGPHEWGEWTVLVECTPTSAGVMEHTCTICGISAKKDYYPDGTLQKGDSGEAVKEVQNNLNDAGYDCGKADGSFGKRTESAIKNYQADQGYEQDGIYWPQYGDFKNGTENNTDPVSTPDNNTDPVSTPNNNTDPVSTPDNDTDPLTAIHAVADSDGKAALNNTDSYNKADAINATAAVQDPYSTPQAPSGNSINEYEYTSDPKTNIPDFHIDASQASGYPYVTGGETLALLYEVTTGDEDPITGVRVTVSILGAGSELKSGETLTKASPVVGTLPYTFTETLAADFAAAGTTSISFLFTATADGGLTDTAVVTVPVKGLSDHGKGALQITAVNFLADGPWKELDPIELDLVIENTGSCTVELDNAFVNSYSYSGSIPVTFGANQLDPGKSCSMHVSFVADNGMFSNDMLAFGIYATGTEIYTDPENGSTETGDPVTSNEVGYCAFLPGGTDGLTAALTLTANGPIPGGNLAVNDTFMLELTLTNSGSRVVDPTAIYAVYGNTGELLMGSFGSSRLFPGESCTVKAGVIMRSEMYTGDHYEFSIHVTGNTVVDAAGLDPTEAGAVGPFGQGANVASNDVPYSGDNVYGFTVIPSNPVTIAKSVLNTPARGYFLENEVIQYEIVTTNGGMVDLYDLYVIDSLQAHSAGVIDYFNCLNAGSSATSYFSYTVQAYDCDVTKSVSNTAWLQNNSIGLDLESNTVVSPCGREPEPSVTTPAFDPRIELPIADGDHCERIWHEDGTLEIRFCAEHKSTLDALTPMMSSAVSEKAMTRACKYAVSLWNGNVTAMRDLLLAKCNEDAAVLVRSDFDSFDSWIDTEEALLEGVCFSASETYGKLAVLEMLRCVDLCQMIHTAPDPIPYAESFVMPAVTDAESCSRAINAKDGSLVCTDSLCDTHAATFMIADTSRVETRTAERVWTIELEMLTDETAEAFPEAADEISESSEAFSTYVAAEKELYSLIYGDAESDARALLLLSERVMNLCGLGK